MRSESLIACLLVVLNVATTCESAQTVEHAVFAAGCYWSVELAFQRVPGVIETSVGFAGGNTPKPTYSDVVSGTTGHAESVKVVYDPSKVNFDKLMTLFWHIHDPTTLNRQGGDVGTQYRSAVWVQTPGQLEAIERSKKELPKDVVNGITTVIQQMDDDFTFWPEEEEMHQQYLQNLGQDASKGSLEPIQCYGNRGPIKDMNKPAIKKVLQEL